MTVKKGPYFASGKVMTIDARMLSIICSFFLILTTNAFADIAKILPVSDGIFRGPRPNEHMLDELKTMGVNTILNIDNDTDAIEWERKQAQIRSFNYISLPMNSFGFPRDHDVDRMLSILNDKSNHPIYLHCKHGEDRTGLVVGLYRIFHEKVSTKQAYEEMISRNFHVALVHLFSYFRYRTRSINRSVLVQTAQSSETK